MTASAATSKGSKSEKLRANWFVVYFEDKCFISEMFHSPPSQSPSATTETQTVAATAAVMRVNLRVGALPTSKAEMR